ncbi:divalent-cation tolerance protein CutA [Candidatus Woesearchaeota archaeon]|nr:divalent-cation tolerance protein CutA [Candidatus Woesearchaeota archaeon]
MISVSITCKNRQEARKIATALLKKRLIACANMHPMESMYWWKGKMEKSREIVLLAKSLEKHFGKIKKEVKKLHSYQIPCIIKCKATANEEYERWVRKETKYSS